MLIPPVLLSTDQLSYYTTSKYKNIDIDINRATIAFGGDLIFSHYSYNIWCDVLWPCRALMRDVICHVLFATYRAICRAGHATSPGKLYTCVDTAVLEGCMECLSTVDERYSSYYVIRSSSYCRSTAIWLASHVASSGPLYITKHRYCCTTIASARVWHDKSLREPEMVKWFMYAVRQTECFETSIECAQVKHKHMYDLYDLYVNVWTGVRVCAEISYHRIQSTFDLSMVRAELSVWDHF